MSKHISPGEATKKLEKEIEEEEAIKERDNVRVHKARDLKYAGMLRLGASLGEVLEMEKREPN